MSRCFGTGNDCSVCCGTGTGCSGMLWHRTWLFRCVVVQEMVLQIYYGTKKWPHDDNY